MTLKGFPCGLTGKESPAMQETWVRVLNWEDPLEKEKATHSSILAWRILWAFTFTVICNSKGGKTKCFTCFLK